MKRCGIQGKHPSTDECLPLTKSKASLVNIFHPSLGLGRCGSEDDIIAVYPNRNVSPNRVTEGNVIDHAQEREGSQLPHQLTSTLTLNYCMTTRNVISQKRTVRIHGMLFNPLRDRKGAIKDLVHKHHLNASVEVISGTLIVTTDKDFPLYRSEIFKL